MRHERLYLPALIVVVLGAMLVPVCLLWDPVRTALVLPATVAETVVAVLLLLRGALDPRCRQGVDAAKREMQRRPSRAFKVFGPSFADPQWGLFGSRTGSRSLQIIRALCLVQFLLALILTGIERPDLLLLAAATFAGAVMLSIVHIGLHTADA